MSYSQYMREAEAKAEAKAASDKVAAQRAAQAEYWKNRSAASSGSTPVSTGLPAGVPLSLRDQVASHVSSAPADAAQAAAELEELRTLSTRAEGFTRAAGDLERVEARAKILLEEAKARFLYAKNGRYGTNDDDYSPSLKAYQEAQTAFRIASENSTRANTAASTVRLQYESARDASGGINPNAPYENESLGFGVKQISDVESYDKQISDLTASAEGLKRYAGTTKQVAAGAEARLATAASNLEIANLALDEQQINDEYALYASGKSATEVQSTLVDAAEGTGYPVPGSDLYLAQKEAERQIAQEAYDTALEERSVAVDNHTDATEEFEKVELQLNRVTDENADYENSAETAWNPESIAAWQKNQDEIAAAEAVSGSGSRRTPTPVNRKAEVKQAYRDYLGREGDTEGVNYWTTVANAQGTQAAVDGIIDGSTGEYREMINNLYHENLGRAADDAGMSHWMEQKLTKNQIESNLIGSDEGIDHAESGYRQTVAALYTKHLGREPDQEGLSFWVERGMQGANLEAQFKTAAANESALRSPVVGVSDTPEIAAQPTAAPAVVEQETETTIPGIATTATESIENKRENYVNEVKALYKEHLGREPDQEGLSYWVDQGLKGTNLNWKFKEAAKAEQAVAASTPVITPVVAAAPTPTPQETYKKQVAALYKKHLGRNADASGLDYWAGRGLGAAELERHFAAAAKTELNARNKAAAAKTAATEAAAAAKATAATKAAAAVQQQQQETRNKAAAASAAAEQSRKDNYKKQVAALYKKHLGRNADASGLDYWVGQGYNTAQLNRHFAAAAQTELNARNKAAAAKTAAASAAAAATAPIKKAPVAAAAPRMSAKEKEVSSLYSSILGRAPDSGGLAYWVGRTDLSTAALRSHFEAAADAELKSKNGVLGAVSTSSSNDRLAAQSSVDFNKDAAGSDSQENTQSSSGMHSGRGSTFVAGNGGMGSMSMTGGSFKGASGGSMYQP